MSSSRIERAGTESRQRKPVFRVSAVHRDPAVHPVLARDRQHLTARGARVRRQRAVGHTANLQHLTAHRSDHTAQRRVFVALRPKRTVSGRRPRSAVRRVLVHLRRPARRSVPVDPNALRIRFTSTVRIAGFRLRASQVTTATRFTTAVAYHRVRSTASTAGADTASHRSRAFPGSHLHKPSAKTAKAAADRPTVGASAVNRRVHPATAAAAAPDHAVRQARPHSGQRRAEHPTLPHCGARTPAAEHILHYAPVEIRKQMFANLLRSAATVRDAPGVRLAARRFAVPILPDAEEMTEKLHQRNCT